MLRRILSSLAIIYASCLHGGNWTPIPPEVWAMKEEVSKGKGAVVLFEKIHYGAKRVEYGYRVRIFSEAGRVGAQFADLPSSASLIEGRTVYPDGREVLFNSAKDMKEVTVKASGGESKRAVLEPPGISTNCVVEIRWKQDPFDWSNFQGEFRRWILNPVPTLESVVEIGTMLPAGAKMEFGSYQPEMKRDSLLKSYTFRNLPSMDSVPFQQRALNQEPRLVVFSQPVWLQDVWPQGPVAFWNAVGDRYFKEFFSARISKGWSWSGFSKEMLADLPAGDPHQRAKEILLRLDARITKSNELTHEERERFKGTNFDVETYPHALSGAVKRGWTSSMGMYYLAYQLLQDAGLNPKLLGVADKYEKVVRAVDQNLYQFDHYMLGVDLPGRGLLLLDPKDRTLPVGAIQSMYQGSTAMRIDTDTWKVGTQEIPVMPADQNLRRFEFQHTLADGKHTMTSQSGFLGVPEYYERDRYFALAPVAQGESLKKAFEERQGGWTLEKTEVRNATDRRKPISLSVAAVREFEDSRRLQINPFPGMPSAIPIPDILPETRQAAICLGYARTHRATARVTLPEGFRLVPAPAMNQKNYFGQVRWEVSQDSAKPSDAMLTYEMVLSEANTSELYYPALLQFLGWVREAQSRSLIVERKN